MHQWIFSQIRIYKLKIITLCVVIIGIAPEIIIIMNPEIFFSRYISERGQIINPLSKGEKRATQDQ